MGSSAFEHVTTFHRRYVGMKHLVFSSKIGRQIRDARAKETEIERKISG